MSEMTFESLLAKSPPADGGAPPPTIKEHCLAVRDAAEVIWDSIEDDLAGSLGIDAGELRRLRPLLLAAAVLHDIGKANSAFQALVNGTGEKKRQPIRHEVLAAVLLMDNRFWGEWFARVVPEESDRWAVAWVLGGHHLELRRQRFGETEDPLFITGGVPKEVSLYLDLSDVKELLEEAQKILLDSKTGSGEVPVRSIPPFDPLDDGPNGLEAMVRQFVRQSNSQWRKLGRDETFKRDVGLLKVLLIAADIAGSGLPAAKKDIQSWVGEKLAVRLDKEQAEDIVKSNLNGRKPHHFQQKVANSDCPVTVVSAGCGNGKTTAAYMWAQKWAKGRKLFFAYPTTGTASVGFRDYLFAQTDLERELIHGRSEVDLKAMFDTRDDVSPIERAQRLESLNAWPQQAIACTVDTVLGLLQNQRRPLFGFPAIACGAFVFDEIHSYDRRLFSELLRFLDTFRGVPVLTMSASIPENRLQALREVAGDRMDDEPIRGDAHIEKIERYTLQNCLDDRELERCWGEVEKALTNGAKVLWVCNTEQDAVDTYQEARKRFADAQILLYHSRYRYGDRVERQKQILCEFEYADGEKTKRKHPRGALAVTTQVCEMSLDISADLLVSALCPLPSLVQRLGRLNRYATKSVPKPALVYPFEGPPYHNEEYPPQMEAARETLATLNCQRCTQKQLAERIDNMQSQEDWPQYSAWLDGGWQSEPLPARDGDNSITLVRAEDIEDLGSKPKRRDVIPLTIPMLLKPGFTWERRVAGYPVAPQGHIEYDEVEGASWVS